MAVAPRKRPPLAPVLSKPLIVVCVALVCALGAVLSLRAAAAGPSTSSVKQFVVIVFDDMRVDDMQYLPQLAALTQREGQSSNNAFIACPLCCPSRSSLMTGLMPSKHGVVTNPSKLRVPTIFPALRSARVKTGLVGKYLNSHGGRPLPEFNFWASFRGGNVRDWLKPRINMNGRFRTFQKYISDIVLEQAEIFTARYASSPYVLYMNFTAPHRPAVTPAEFEKSCAALQLPADFNSIDTTAPAKYQELRTLRADRVLNYLCERASSLRYLDHKVTQFVKGLAEKGVTVFIVSDNGVMLGEYRLREKGFPYPQVVRSPFLAFNYPQIESNRVVSLVDIPATILKTFGVAAPNNQLDGIPLDEPRTSALIEYLDYRPYRKSRRIPFTAIATPGRISVTYDGGFRQELRY